MKQKKYFKTIIFIIIAMLLIVGTPLAVWAADEASKDDSNDDYTLEDTVITGTKTGNTKVQETSGSISAFNMEEFKLGGAERVQEVIYMVPNMASNTVDTSPNSKVFIRGIGGKTGDASTGFYIDGVYYPSGGGANLPFMNIERVEVLRGPQGTLYGAGSIGGVVNILTMPPSDEFQFSSGFEYGSFNKIKADAYISGPVIKDKMSANLSVLHLERDGYMENKTPGMENSQDNGTDGVRGTLRFTPNEKWDISFKADFTKEDSHFALSKPLNDSALGPFYGGTRYDDFWTISTDMQSKRDLEIGGANLTINIDISDNINLSSISSYRIHHDDSKNQDIDATELFIYSIDQKSDRDGLQQEFRLNFSVFDSKVTGLLGLYYFNLDSDGYMVTHQNVGPTFGLPVSMNVSQDAYITSGSEENTYAGFGQVTYNFTDQWSGTAGLRYGVEKVSSSSQISWAIPAYVMSGDNPETKFDESWTILTPKAVLKYKASEEMMVYVSAAEGFKSGGLNANTGTTVDPETLWSYEIGVKSDWLDNRLRINATAFLNELEDMQVESFIAGVSALHNAGEAEIKGVELEIMARPVPELTLGANIGYLDAEFTSFKNAVNSAGIGEDASGNTMPFSPELTVNLSATYIYPIGNFGFLTLSGNMSYSDDIHYGEFEESYLTQEAFTLYNAFVRIDSKDGTWSLSAYGKNLTNEEYANVIFDWNEFADGADGYLGMPRTFGMELRYNF